MKNYYFGKLYYKTIIKSGNKKCSETMYRCYWEKSPEKEFSLLNPIVDRLDPERFSFVFKTPGFKLEKEYSHVKYEPGSNISSLSYWPPRDVWEFYNKVDLILILSKVESFGNVTFEAGISNCSIIINQQVTGADIAKSLGFDVHTYNNFDASEICETIENVKIIKKTKHKEI